MTAPENQPLPPSASGSSRWLPLRLLVVALLIPLLGGLLWVHRAAIPHEEALERVYQICRLSPSILTRLLHAARPWPAARRAWLVDALMQHPDLYGGRSDYDLYDDDDASFFGMPTLSAPDATPAFDLDLLLVLDPENRDALRLKAERLYRVEEYSQCALCVERLIEHAKAEDSDGTYREYTLLGSALYRMDRFAEAQKQFEMAALMRPNSLAALGILTRVLARQGKYEEAIRLSTRMLAAAQERQESMPSILLERGQMLGLIGRHDLALRDLDAAAAPRDRAPRSWINENFTLQLGLQRADALLSMHQPERALAELQDLLRQFPTDPRVLQ